MGVHLSDYVVGVDLWGKEGFEDVSWREDLWSCHEGLYSLGCHCGITDSGFCKEGIFGVIFSEVFYELEARDVVESERVNDDEDDLIWFWGGLG